MFRFVIVSVVFVAAHCGHHIGHHGGSSKTHRKQDDFGHYEFGYDIKDGYGNINGRQEKGSHDQVVGSYYLGEIDGRQRTVEYVADKLGFRATIKTNEHGTKTSEPAFAPITSDFGKTIPSGSIRVAGHHGHHHEEHYGGHEHVVEGHETHESAHHAAPSYGHAQEASHGHHHHSEPAYEHGHEYAESAPVAYTMKSLNYKDLAALEPHLNGAYRKLFYVTP